MDGFYDYYDGETDCGDYAAEIREDTILEMKEEFEIERKKLLAKIARLERQITKLKKALSDGH